MSNNDWPENVIARYLTVAGTTVDSNATVDVETLRNIDNEEISTRSTCRGCGSTDFHDYESYRHYSDQIARVRVSRSEACAWAQSHAETCRAMPKPEGAAR